MSVPYQDLFEVVKRKIFDDIFNYTDITLKNNVRMAILNNGRPVRGLIYTNVITVILPEPTSSYYLFMCSNVPISNLLVSATGWTRLEDVLNEHGVNVDFITSDNKMIPKYMVFGRVGHGGDTLIAVDARAYAKLNAQTETYLVINIDTNDVGQRTVISHIPGYHENISNLLSATNQHPADQRIGFINGYAYRNDIFNTSGSPTSDYYELYIDENVKFTFVVDMAIRNTYLCSDESLYKDIVIIPNNLTNGEVFTSDTVSIIVRTYDGKGVYLPFLAPNSVSQLTHTSFSVSSYLIDAAFDKLGVTKGELYVIVGDYSKNNVNVMNGDSTEQLYHLGDTTIMSAFLNKLDPKVPYWAADRMERSAYAKYLIDMTEQDNYSSDLIGKQIECLGYYSFINTLCKHNGEFDNLGNSVTSLTIQVPIFWKDTDVTPILYLDGNKIYTNRFTYTRVGTELSINFETPLPINFPYSVITYELMVSPVARTRVCVPGIGLQVISVPKYDNSATHIFRKTSGVVTGITTSQYPAYEELPVDNTQFYSVMNHESEYVISFNNASYGNEFLITTNLITAVNIYQNLDIGDGRTLVFMPSVPVVDSTDVASVFVSGDYDVYLNGRFLVIGLDYNVNEITNDAGTLTGGYMITIQNLKFLRDTGPNYVGIYKTGRITLSSDSGYIVDGIIPRNPNNEAWIEGVSRLFINGKRVPFGCVTHNDTHYEVDAKYRGNGYIYHFSNAVSRDFYNAYAAYMDSRYFNGRLDISNYFTHGYHYTYPDPIIISNGNKLYSSYLNEIIRRIVAGGIFVNDIADDVDIIEQLASYESLKKFDVMFDDNNKIDRRFIDMYPGYLATTSITDLNHYMYIQRLVRIVLGADAATDHLIVYTGRL